MKIRNGRVEIKVEQKEHILRKYTHTHNARNHHANATYLRVKDKYGGEHATCSNLDVK